MLITLVVVGVLAFGLAGWGAAYAIGDKPMLGVQVVGFGIVEAGLVAQAIVAAVLMSMGMMMVPPAVVALPFKLAFFVVADGWTLVSSALVRSYL